MKKNILSFCMLLLFISTSAAAEETTLFEQKYSWTPGAPNVYTDTFSAAAGKGMLIIKNGSWNGKKRNGFWKGKKRIVDAIRSASIFVNGQQVFGCRHFKKRFRLLKKSVNGRRNFCPRYFKKRVHLLEIPVDLLEGDNEISIKLAGRPGSYLTLEVKGEEFPVETYLPTTKGGSLEVDETWSGEVTVIGDVVVPQEVTLTIAPGTEVRFSALSDDEVSGSDDLLCKLIIEGSLVAEGSEDQKVRFTSSNTSNPTAGDWYGIVVQPSSGEASINLSNCIVEYANSGINAVATGPDVSLTITDSEVLHSSGDGIYIDANSGSVITLDIDNTDITDNGGCGIYCYVIDDNSQIAGGITNSTIANNNSYGLHVYLDNHAISNLDIIGNTIYGNNYFGIYAKIYFSDSNESIFNIKNNTLYNSGTGIYFYVLGGRVTTNITENEVYSEIEDGINCYAFWGSTFSALIAGNTIHDNEGDGIYYEASEPVDVLDNDIHDNRGRGLYLNAGDGSRVNNNNLYNSGSYDLENGNSYNIDGESNFWGTYNTTGAAISARIYDYNDDQVIGTVDYDPWDYIVK